MKAFAAIIGVSTASVLALAHAAEKDPYNWSSARVVETDLDRSGGVDSFKLGVAKDRVGLLVTLDSKPLPLIEIPIDGSKEFGICSGSEPSIRVVPQSEAPLNALGETPPGYKICPTCYEVVVSGGACDPLQFYWDTEANKLSWWRA